MKVNPKEYPYFNELIVLLQNAGHRLIQIGVEGEEQLVEDFRKNLNCINLKQLLDESDTFIAIDSFLQHLAWYYGKRGIVIFGKSDDKIFGHVENVNLLKSREYLRKHQFWLWSQETCNDDVFITPDKVMSALNDNFIQ